MATGYCGNAGIDNDNKRGGNAGIDNDNGRGVGSIMTTSVVATLVSIMTTSVVATLYSVDTGNGDCRYDYNDNTRYTSLFPQDIIQEIYIYIFYIGIQYMRR